MRYQWGPLLRDGGERRLNVAATRARRRLTVVSSFSSHDVDPSRLTAPGARMLADYLEYARAGGIPVVPVPVSSAGYVGGDGQQAPDGPGEAGAFHSDVAARLAALGITVVPQYGVGGYRVDFAAAHPDDPARMILAIEADGAGYRDSGSVRDRDRLRKEHLERLGWHVHRLWSTAWFTDPGGELAPPRPHRRPHPRPHPRPHRRPGQRAAPQGRTRRRNRTRRWSRTCRWGRKRRPRRLGPGTRTSPGRSRPCRRTSTGRYRRTPSSPSPRFHLAQANARN
jgi:very-short-patch-repair endonuclease